MFGGINEKLLYLFCAQNHRSKREPGCAVKESINIHIINANFRNGLEKSMVNKVHNI